ncbi:zinc finger MYM-type 1-like [Pelobates cultripes]|uniref:Zinc finger MYM-type 1-like n=1 Tax=Pelobates cultripes TaxID=61616 RepID=A0AAD1S7R6_PELCU|nr:zinc finger MYM-type 1-like [Pelobates cultripes]
MSSSEGYKHKSGAMKRKEKKEEQKKIEASTSKIHKFFQKKTDPEQDVASGMPVETETSVSETSNVCVLAEETKEREPPIKMPRKETALSPLWEKSPSPEDFFLHSHDLGKAGISMEMFWEFHPKQPTQDIPFNGNLVYFRKGIQGSNINRKWVTYNGKKKTLHCSICLMYCAEKYHHTHWIQGCNDWRHITTRLTEHEQSQCHKLASEAYMINIKGKSIKHKLSVDQLSMRHNQVLQRRTVLSNIIDVVFFIGIQALPYRSSHSESVADVFDDDRLENRGNFLEAVKLLAEYSPVLKDHLVKVTKVAKNRDPSQKGRGKFVTFLSKSSITKLFTIIGDMIKEDIVKEVNNAGMFSVQMDSTQDVSAHDQCAIVVRYVVEDKAKERLVRLLNVEDSSSKGLHDLLRDSLSDIGLNLEQCIGDSFDGAANMSGTYTGLQALMTEVRPSHIQTWCYAHVLNLVICDASSVCVPAVSLFGLLGNLSTFFSESYKRIKIWEDQLKAKTGSAKLKRLDKIGTTRWSSKARALRKLCGTYENHSEELYSDLILVLKHVSSSSDFRNSVRHEALKLNENLCKFETILATFTFIRIFDITTPVSDYLQSPALDIMQAWRMVEDATNRLSKISRDFSGVCGSATTFIDHLNEKLAAEDIAISKSFTEHRSTRCVVPANQQHSFEVSCYNVICDKVLESMRTRFATHGKLYMQISCFDPNRFEEILASPEKIKFDAISTAVPEIDGPVLREELISFASSYRNLSRGLFDSDDETLSSAGEEEPDFSDSEPSACKPSMKKLCCQKCTSCAFKLLFQYRLCSSAYENLYMAYKYLITLSTTQCSCEQCFSKLKILKSRLRSTLTQQNLETLMLIAIEKDVSLSIKRDKEKIIDRFGKTSAELRSLLLF